MAKNFKIKVAFLIILAMNFYHRAASAQAYAEAFDFIAPVVSSDSDVANNKQVGLIYYDINYGYKGINKNGTADLLTRNVTSPVSGGGVVKIASAKITVNGAGNSCSIAAQDGTWLSSCAYVSTGIYNLNISASTFTASPNCTANAIQTDTRAVMINSATTSQLNIRIKEDTNSVINADFYLICVGTN